MSYHLQRINSSLQDDHFWQILVTCSHNDIITHGESFLAYMEEYSPGLRVIFNFTSSHDEAEKFITGITKYIYSSIIYTIRSSQNSKEYLDSDSASKWLLRATLQPVLIMDIRISCRQDLNFLPVDLYNTDIAVWSAKEETGPYVTWLHSNWQNKGLVRRHSRWLETIMVGGSSQNSRSYGKQKKVSSLVKYSQFPEYYKFAIGAPLKKLTRPDIIIFAQKQDVGTKHLLKKNGFLMRIERLSKPGRAAWRLFPNIIELYERSQNNTCKIVPIAQWEITEPLIEKYSSFKKVYVPHQSRTQLDKQNSLFYMQEYLFQIFTVGKNGWGPEGDAYQSTEYLRHSIDPQY